ncbi:MAG TPA: hypothetical protein VNZ61_02965 [Roseomonas sp.]|nr:hypothetical protein [Roseomonas sp.]
MTPSANPSIEIPREPTFLREYRGEFVRQDLPVTASPRRAILLLGATFSLVMGSLCLFAASLALQSPFSSSARMDALVRLSVAVLEFAAAAICLLVSALFVRYLLQPAQSFVLDQEGITDARYLTRKLQWQDVESATIRMAGTRFPMWWVHLKFRPGIDRDSLVRRFPLAAWPLRPWDGSVLISFMDQSPHVLGYTVLALVRRAGGTTSDSGKRPWPREP